MAITYFAGKSGYTSGNWYTDLLSRGVVGGITGRLCADGNRWVRIVSQQMYISGDGASRTVSMYTANSDGSSKTNTGSFSVNFSNPAQSTGYVALNRNFNAVGQSLMVGFNAPSGLIRFGINSGTGGTVQLIGGGGGVVANYTNTSLAGSWSWIQAPSEPRNLTAVNAGSNVNLTWQVPVTNGDTALTGYVLQYSSDNFATFTTVNYGPTVTSATVTPGAAPEWKFRIAARNAVTDANSTWSLYSNVVAAAGYTVPNAPTSLTGTVLPLRVDLSWVAPSNTGGSPLTGYRLQWRPQYGSWSSIELGLVTNYTLNVSTAGNYEVRVAAKNIVGVGDYTATSLFTIPQHVIPSQPTSFTATALTNAIGLSWGAPTNIGGAPITNYKIYYNLVGQPEQSITLGVVNNYTITGLTSAAYEVSVSAINAAGEGPRTAILTRTPVAVPSVPRFPYVETEIGTVRLSWQTPANAGGSPITSYAIRYRVGSGAWTTINVGLVQNYVLNVPANTYQIEIYAINSVGDGVPVTLNNVIVPLYVSPNPELKIVTGIGEVGEISNYSITQGVPSTNLYDTSGGVTTLNISAKRKPSSKFIANNEVELWRYGTLLGGGVVETHNYDLASISFSAEGYLRKTVVEKTMPPVMEMTVDEIFKFYFAQCDVPESVLEIDSTLSGIVATYPGWQGEVWLHIKQLGSIHNMEVVELGRRVYVRPYFSAGTIRAEKESAVSFSADYSNAALTVEVNYNEATPLYNDIVFPLNEQDNGNIITVEAGVDVEREIELDVYLQSVSQPVARDVDVNPPNQLAESEYMIIDKDNRPISAAYWTDKGGRVEVEILEPSNKILVKVTAPQEGSAGSPYKLAITDNDQTMQRLFLVGTGVRVDGGTISLGTGTDTSITTKEVGATIDSPFVVTMGDAYVEAAKAAKMCSGLTARANITRLGQRVSSRVLGGRMYIDDNKWRIRDFSESPSTQSISMDVAFDYLDDAESVGELTYAEWSALQGDATYGDLEVYGFGPQT